jgi:hypothetical protein
VRAAFPAEALGGGLVAYFCPPTARSEAWCIRVDVNDLRAIGDPIRFTQEWAWSGFGRLPIGLSGVGQIRRWSQVMTPREVLSRIDSLYLERRSPARTIAPAIPTP